MDIYICTTLPSICTLVYGEKDIHNFENFVYMSKVIH